jgi:uncharacterized membrane protein
MRDPREAERSGRADERTPLSIWMLAALFGVAGALHLIFPEPYVRIVPPIFPAPQALVFASGLFELVGAAGLLMPSWRRLAGIGLIALLALVLPANVQMLSNARASGAESWWILALMLRLPLQPLLAWWIWRVAVRGRYTGARPRAA